MAKKVAVLLAEGFEEVEAITPIDYLRRADIEVTVAAAGNELTIAGSHSIPVKADVLLSDLAGLGGASASVNAAAFDAVLIPGGLKGAKNIASSAEAGALLKDMAAAGKWVCAICAAPAVVLYPLGLLAGKRFTCYPGLEEDVKGATWSKDSVVVDANVGGGGFITSRAAGTAGLFAIAVIEQLLSKADAKKIAQSVLL
ncbi:MAG: DJ-1/PfpI family protein [Treponema sp.]|jgi:4-methyl-5(b-hydroxyethyl)-thiazole monophosphate biosynthesis|nr:DJ-1/PfpI family protein [Treponema sp.]